MPLRMPFKRKSKGQRPDIDAVAPMMKDEGSGTCLLILLCLCSSYNVIYISYISNTLEENWR